MRNDAAASLACGPLHAQRQGPGYPTRLAVRARPALLARHVPNAWRRRGMRRLVEVALASGAAAGATAGCTASTSCIAVVPPASYSEEEALKIIQTELAAHHIELGRATEPLQGVTLSWSGGQEQTYRPDLVSADGKIALEYIARDDFEQCSRQAFMRKSTLEISVACGAPKVQYRALVVPKVYDTWQRGYREPTEREFREELRKQVRDFCEWIATQERP